MKKPYIPHYSKTGELINEEEEDERHFWRDIAYIHTGIDFEKEEHEAEITKLKASRDKLIDKISLAKAFNKHARFYPNGDICINDDWKQSWKDWSEEEDEKSKQEVKK